MYGKAFSPRGQSSAGAGCPDLQSPPFEGRSYHTYSFTHVEGGNEYINRRE